MYRVRKIEHLVTRNLNSYFTRSLTTLHKRVTLSLNCQLGKYFFKLENFNSKEENFDFEASKSLEKKWVPKLDEMQDLYSQNHEVYKLYAQHSSEKCRILILYFYFTSFEQTCPKNTYYQCFRIHLVNCI